MEQNKNRKTIKIGINRAIFEKRLSLKLSRKEASKKLGINKIHLTIIERGYIKISPKMKEKFKTAYNLKDEFFFENHEYPIIIDEKLYEPFKANKIFKRVSDSVLFKCITGFLSLVFIGVTVFGFIDLPSINHRTGYYYSATTKTTQNIVVSNGIKGDKKDELSRMSLIVFDDYYYLEKKDVSLSASYQNLRINFFTKEDSLPQTFYSARINDTINNYVITYEDRYVDNSLRRIHFSIKNNEGIIISQILCNASVFNDAEISYNFNTVTERRGDEGNITIKPKDANYEVFTGIFKDFYEKLNQDIQVFFNDGSIPLINFNEFDKDMKSGTNEFQYHSKRGRYLVAFGFILALLSLGILAFSFIYKPYIKRREKRFALDEKIEMEMPLETVRKEEKKSILPKNNWKDLFVPEFIVRAISLILLFVSSIAIYFLFENAIRFDVIGVNNSLLSKEMLSNLSVIAIMLLYFVKLDIYQNKKSAFAMCLFLFILGILYYVVLVIVYYLLCGLGDNMSSTVDSIFNLLPGNIVWAVMAFDQFTIFLFAPVAKKYQNKNKQILFRCFSLVPLSYLIASSIITIGMKVAGWSIPYSISSLFFYKAPMITVFAILYCFGVFLYRRYSIKKYGTTNGLIYQLGNRYNYFRNIYGALIIFIIGIFDLIMLFIMPNNKLGFGSNFLMLISIPFIIFYHPHIGKRNGSWDIVFNVLYAFAYLAGIVFVVLAVFKILSVI